MAGSKKGKVKKKKADAVSKEDREKRTDGIIAGIKKILSRFNGANDSQIDLFKEGMRNGDARAFLQRDLLDKLKALPKPRAVEEKDNQEFNAIIISIKDVFDAAFTSFLQKCKRNGAFEYVPSNLRKDEFFFADYVEDVDPDLGKLLVDNKLIVSIAWVECCCKIMSQLDRVFIQKDAKERLRQIGKVQDGIAELESKVLRKYGVVHVQVRSPEVASYEQSVNGSVPGFVAGLTSVRSQVPEPPPPHSLNDPDNTVKEKEFKAAIGLLFETIRRKEAQYIYDVKREELIKPEIVEIAKQVKNLDKKRDSVPLEKSEDVREGFDEVDRLGESLIARALQLSTKHQALVESVEQECDIHLNETNFKSLLAKALGPILGGLSICSNPASQSISDGREDLEEPTVAVKTAPAAASQVPRNYALFPSSTSPTSPVSPFFSPPASPASPVSPLIPSTASPTFFPLANSSSPETRSSRSVMSPQPGRQPKTNKSYWPSSEKSTRDWEQLRPQQHNSSPMPAVP